MRALVVGHAPRAILRLGVGEQVDLETSQDLIEVTLRDVHGWFGGG